MRNDGKSAAPNSSAREMVENRTSNAAITHIAVINGAEQNRPGPYNNSGIDNFII
jgi:hypothetical protein